jgi:hypothetical protein
MGGLASQSCRGTRSKVDNWSRQHCFRGTSYQKRQIMSKGGLGKEENTVTMRNLLGRSPDFGRGLTMRMSFEVVNCRNSTQ